MGKSKTYSYEYDDYENGKNAETMVKDILADPEFPELEELIIGGWGGEYEADCQPILNAIADDPDKFSHITKLFVGDMDYEVCEVSWIMQGDYSRIWKAMPQLKELTIKGSMDLALGEIAHDNLESLTIICGGLGQDVMEEIRNAKLPNLKKLLLYVGVEDYGFDGNADTIKELLAGSDFPKLSYLGIVDSEIQDELTEVVLESKYIHQIETLDLSCGTLTDKGGNLLLEKLPAFPNIKKLDVHHHYLSDEVMGKLEKLSMEVDVSEQEEAEKWNGKIWYSAMLTE
ncbi:MAG: STM4015 family protein [Lachnospiraceae bacterium]|nr:STM4015 family protein [Lachnospiraceae bacterium]MCM1240759.1 STM4015 family protein [Lachnospiraceae bacterium]MCM1240826.1 STM4015 family protein [Lachnospiraceae bacterium]